MNENRRFERIPERLTIDYTVLYWANRSQIPMELHATAESENLSEGGSLFAARELIPLEKANDDFARLLHPARRLRGELEVYLPPGDARQIFLLEAVAVEGHHRVILRQARLLPSLCAGTLSDPRTA